MAAATKKRKEEAYPWKAGASSGHITNLKQSILETFDIYAQLSMEQRTFKNCKQLFEYKHLLLLRDIWWSKL
jgi:hypothetical protein